MCICKKKRNPLCQNQIIFFIYHRFAFLNKNSVEKNMSFITENTMCDILMRLGGGAANSAKLMHEGLLTQFARKNGVFSLSKPDFKSAQL